MADSACPNCGGSGFGIAVDERGVAVARPCDCRPREREHELTRLARIPPRYDHCTLGTFEAQDPSQALAAQAARDWVERWPAVDHGLLFVGPPGTGKTHLAVAIARELIRGKGARALFYEQRELLKALQGTFDEGAARTESQVFGPVQSAEVLVLDDLGAGRITAWARDVMHDVISHRYNRRLPLVMTSNHPLDDEATGTAADVDRELTLVDRLGRALLSRIHEMCRIVAVNGRDFRRGVLNAKIDRA